MTEGMLSFLTAQLSTSPSWLPFVVAMIGACVSIAGCDIFQRGFQSAGTIIIIIGVGMILINTGIVGAMVLMDFGDPDAAIGVDPTTIQDTGDTVKLEVDLTLPADLRESRTFENDDYRITVEPLDGDGGQFREVP